MKTPLLAVLRQAFLLAQQSHLQPHRPVEELLAERQAFRADRRRFLRTALQVGAVAAVGGPGCLTRTVVGSALSRVAIVGGGLAGLNAARHLRRMGLSVPVYEADKRIGGRVRSAKVFADGQLTTEFGAEFIDTGHQDMRDLAQGLGLQVMDVDTDTFGEKDAFYVNGRHYQLADIIAELNPVYARIAADSKRADKGDAAAEFDRLSMEQYVDRLPLSSWLKTMLNAAFVGENGLEAGEQSALNFIWTLGTEKDQFQIFGDSDERFKVIGGNEQIPQRLAQTLADQLRLEHRLTAVRENSNGSLRLTFATPGGTVEETYDAVILAVPFTVLREVDVQMEMPPLKRQVIQELGYGANTKFILETKGRPWRDAGYRGFLFNEKVHNGWDSAQMQLDNQGAGTFTVYYGGRRAVEARRGTEAEQLAYSMPVLEGAFPGFKNSLTGKHELLHWPSNPFVKASYSCFRVGQAAPFDGVAFEPVRNLYFAGEHCSVDYWGFMNGAAETGRRVAESVGKRMRLATKAG